MAAGLMSSLEGCRRGGGGRGEKEGALALAGAVASRCRVRHDVSICAGAGGEATAVGSVVTSQAQRAVIYGLLRALGRLDAGD